MVGNQDKSIKETAIEAAYRGTGFFDYIRPKQRLHISDGMKGLLGLNRNNILDSMNSFLGYLSPEDFASTIEIFKQAFRNREAMVNMRFKVLKKSGEIIWVRSLTNIYYDNEGFYQRISGFIYEITKSIESFEILEKDRARQISSFNTMVLGTMAAGIAHEVGSPLLCINAAADFLNSRENYAEMDFDELKSFFQVIKDSAVTIGRIVSGIKIFSYDETPEIPLISSLSEIAKNSIMLCEGRFRDNNVLLETEFQEINILVSCVKNKISQVIFSLLSNAFDAVQKTADKKIKLVLIKSEGFAVLSCIDSGEGVSEENKSKIMDPFFTTKPPGFGTGLGLTVARAIVESHGGKLWLASSDFGMTEFILSLPLVASKPTT